MSIGISKRNKGFTLVELVIVIVVIAILIAALTPAIMGVINRANASADQADARSVMLAASIASTLQNPPTILPTGSTGATQIVNAFGSTTEVGRIHDGAYRVFFASPTSSMAIGVEMNFGRRNSPAVDANIIRFGDTSSTNTVRVITIDGSTVTVTAGT